MGIKMEEIRIYICEDSLEGIFTGIYQAYQEKANLAATELAVGEIDNYRLFAQYNIVETKEDRAGKVARTILREFGEETYLDICRAASEKDAEKANAIYQTVGYGLLHKSKSTLMGNLQNVHVHKVFELSRSAANEIQHLIQFIRFQELENGLLFSKIGPKCNVLTFLAPHFADRLPLENFVIYDEIRHLFMIHPAGRECFLTTGEDFDESISERYSDREQRYQELFRHFCHTIAIKERKNTDLQRQMLPIRFRKYMMDFSNNS